MGRRRPRRDGNVRRTQKGGQLVVAPVARYTAQQSSFPHGLRPPPPCRFPGTKSATTPSPLPATGPARAARAAEKQTFWNEFFARFRHFPARRWRRLRSRSGTLAGNYGYIDLFWPRHDAGGTQEPRARILARPSRRLPLHSQTSCTHGRHDEVPRYVIVSDFAGISLHDLEPEDPEKVTRFRAATGSSSRWPSCTATSTISPSFPAINSTSFEDPDPINLEAVRIMDDLHDALKAGGYGGHELERLLVRILFCLFAQSTGHLRAGRLSLLHRGPHEAGRHRPRAAPGAALRRAQHAAGETASRTWTKRWPRFPTSTASLFAEKLGFADFNRDMRNSLLACTRFDWSQHFAGHFRLAVPGRDGAARTPPDRRPLHQRARHPQGHPPAVSRRPAGGVRAGQGRTRTN